MPAKNQSTIKGHIKRRKRITLSALEDSKDFSSLVQYVAQMAAKAAIAESKALKIPVTYLQGNKIVKKYPDGKVEVIGKIINQKPAVMLRKGSVLHAKKS
jgi:CHASE2 domain-containing sensor protein